MDSKFRRFVIGIFLVALVTLSFQVALSYEFAFMFWFNVSITVISIAMFGLGVGGVLGYFISKKSPHNYFKALFYSSLLFGLFILISIYSIASASTDFNQSNIEQTTFYSIVSAVPFVFAGIILSMGLNYPVSDKRAISYIYFADLLGAGIGSLALTALLPLTSLEIILLILSLTAMLAAPLFKTPDKREITALTSLAFAALVFFTMFSSNLVPSPSSDKFLPRLLANNATIIDTSWTSVSRVDVVEYADKSRIRFIVNGNFPVTVSTGNIDSPNNEKDTRYIMFYKNPRNMVAIGSGGGVELTLGLHAGVDDITAVEINPYIIQYMKDHLSDYSRQIYYSPKVKTVIEDGRTYVHRSKEKYDLIENGVIGNNGLVVPSSTVLTFQDAYVYTVEANRDYFRHLTEDGVAVTIIYGLLDNYNSFQPEKGITYYLLRQYFTVYEALEKEGVDPLKHIVIMRFVQPAGNLQPLTAQAEYTFIFKKPLTPADVEELVEKGRQYNLVPAVAPFYADSLNFEEIAASLPPGRSVDPSRDDRPFFYHTETSIPEVLKRMLSLLGVLTFVLILIPVMIDRKFTFEHKASSYLLIYFLCLGLGFILIEAVIIQKLTLFLGRPAYAFQVVLFSMLVFSGLGSYTTGRLIPSNKGILRNTQRILAVTASAILIWSIFLQKFIYGFMHFDIFSKVLLSISYIAVLSFLMGMPFPLGLRITSYLSQNDVIWMYGVNGAGSVMGSIIGMMIAFKYGFSYSLLSGGAIYIISFLIMIIVGLKLRGNLAG